MVFCVVSLRDVVVDSVVSNMEFVPVVVDVCLPAGDVMVEKGSVGLR